jgi:hypothetical protein
MSHESTPGVAGLPVTRPADCPFAPLGAGPDP